MTILAIPVGVLIGLSLGALGGGGSILTVPALVYLLGQGPHQATAASLLVVGVAAVVGAVTHARAGRVRLKAGVVFGALGIAGSYLGSRLSAAVPESVLLAGFGTLMLAAATAMVVRQRRAPGAPTGDGRAGPPAGGAARVRQAGTSGEAAAAATGAQTAQPDAAAAHHATLTMERPRQSGLPGHDRRGASAARVPGGAGTRTPVRQALLVTGAATAVGLITGFFGVGGGFLVVPVLVLVLGFDMAAAAGTSLVVIAIDSAAALLSRAGHGMLTLDWALVGTFTAAAVLGALAGGRLAGRVNPVRLATAFTVLIFVVAVYTLARSIPGLA